MLLLSRKHTPPLPTHRVAELEGTEKVLELGKIGDLGAGHAPANAGNAGQRAGQLAVEGREAGGQRLAEARVMEHKLGHLGACARELHAEQDGVAGLVARRPAGVHKGQQGGEDRKAVARRLGSRLRPLAVRGFRSCPVVCAKEELSKEMREGRGG